MATRIVFTAFWVVAAIKLRDPLAKDKYEAKLREAEEFNDKLKAALILHAEEWADIIVLNSGERIAASAILRDNLPNGAITGLAYGPTLLYAVMFLNYAATAAGKPQEAMPYTVRRPFPHRALAKKAEWPVVRDALADLAISLSNSQPIENTLICEVEGINQQNYAASR